MSATLAVLAAAAANAALAALILAACGLAGFALLPARLRPGSAAASLAVSLSLGAAAAGWTSWIVGTLAGTKLLPVLWLGLVALGVRVLRPFAAVLRRAGRRLWALFRASPLLSGALLLAVLPLGFPLASPLLDNDGIRYHVALPKLYLLTGRIFLYPWDVTGAYPQLGDVLYLVGLAAGTAETAKHIHAGFFAAATAVLALALHRGRSSRGASVAGALLFVASPVAGVVAGAGFIDHIALFHLVTAFVLATRKGRPVLVGLSLGAALATKLTLGPAAAAVALASALSRPRRERLRAFFAVSAAATAVLAPFALRNVLALGDPFYPIGRLALGRPTPGVSPEAFEGFTSFNAGRAGLLGVVWQSPGTGSEDETAGVHHLVGLVLLLAGFRDRLVRWALLLVLPFLLHAAVSSPPTRYLLPLLWGLSLATAAFLPRLLSGKGVWLALPLAFPAVVLSWQYQARAFHAADYLFGRLSREELLARVVPGYRAARFVNALPPGGVMAGDFPGPVFFERPWLVEGIVNEAPLTTWIRAGEGAERLLARLRENGIRWLLATPAFGGGTRLSLLTYAPDPSFAPVTLALRSRLRFVARVDGVDVYEVPPEGGVPFPR